MRKILLREINHLFVSTDRRWVSSDIHSLDALSDIANALQVEVRDIFAEDVPFELLLQNELKAYDYYNKVV